MGKFRDKGRIPGGYVAVLKDTLDSPAWRAMSMGARCLYIELKRPYNRDLGNNGRLFLPVRKAVIQSGTSRQQIGRWFRELQHYGFIVMTTKHQLGVEGEGRAARWKLTEVSYMKEEPTREFMKWDGKKFRAQNKGQFQKRGNRRSDIAIVSTSLQHVMV
jgi:hypothetical protein